MKRLFLIRHAKAAASRPGLPDFERALVKRGVRTAKDMARRLREQGIKPGLLVSSPAHRALETAHIFAAEFDYPLQKIRLEDVLYEQTTREALLGLVRRLDAACPTVLVFGHNPALQDFAQFLVKDLPGRLPKMGVLGVELPSDSWRSATPGAEKLAFFDYPEREAEEARQKADDLSAQVSHAVEVVLGRIDPSGRADVLPLVERSGRKIAAEFLAALEKRRSAEAGGKERRGEKPGPGPPPAKKSTKAGRPGRATIKPVQGSKKARRPLGTIARTRKLRYVKPGLEKKDTKWISAPALVRRPASRPRRTSPAKNRPSSAARRPSKK